MIYFVRLCYSTQDLAKSLEREGVFIAYEQKRGRGKEGRIWYSPAGLGLYMTVAVAIELNPNQLPLVVHKVALEICNWLGTFGLEAGIKKPNDVIVKGKKIAGILAETRIKKGQPSFLYIGIGINLNHSLSDFPFYLKEKATSLFIEKKLKIHPLYAGSQLGERLMKMLKKDFLIKKESA